MERNEHKGRIRRLAGNADRWQRKRAHGGLPFAAVGKLTALITGLGLALVTAPGAIAAPVPQQQGSDCDSNYSGACVPIASDVDCAGGSGNGPEYVTGPVYVVGDDIYELDRDGDGVACEG